MLFPGCASLLAPTGHRIMAVKRSEQRILTTHTGSLPRSQKLLELMLAREDGTASPVELDEEIRRGVDDIVARQVATGVAVVNDGEVSKLGFNIYAKDRLTGLDGQGPRGASPSGDHTALHGGPLDRREHPDLVMPGSAVQSRLSTWPACTGPITYKGGPDVARDIANLKHAVGLAQPVDAFMTAAAPGALSTIFGEGYYPTYEAYVFAVADAMREEYKAITDAGLVLQLDAPDLAMERHMKFAESSEEAFVNVVGIHVEALNRAIQGLPKEQIRLHVCWGNYPGPHTFDIPLRSILGTLLTAQVGALSIEASNPRHEHEWHIFEDVKLPDGMILIPGVIDSCTNYVEHPELVAERIVRLAKLVGRENILAGTDCGFGTFAGRDVVAASVAWRKLQSLAEGAELATKVLW